MKNEKIFKRNLLKLTKRYSIFYQHKTRLEKKLDKGSITDKEREVLIGLDNKIEKKKKKIEKLRNSYEN